MATKRRYENILDEYSTKRDLYTEFAARLDGILADVLLAKGQQYLSIESRSKTIESLRQKLYFTDYNPISIEKINDLAGVRIITFVYENISSIEEVLKECFDVVPIDVDGRLGVDRVGYRSHHWILSLPEARLTLPEYEKFAGMKAELQIRTVLQHAWAQIGHNQVYKPSAILPERIERDFKLLSGVLEVADNEFSRISNEIASHQKEVERMTLSGNLDIPVDSVSLRQYFNDKFSISPLIKTTFGPKDDMAEEIIDELKAMGVDTLEELDKIMPKNFDVLFKRESSFTGLARLIMILHDSELYFSKAWNEKWIMTKDSADFYASIGIDVKKLFEKYPNLDLGLDESFAA